jgi:hypothetical protein
MDGQPVDVNEPLQVYKHLPVIVIEAMKTPGDQTVNSLCGITRKTELRTLLWWNALIQGGDGTHS